jgi:predicted dehydrogenase
MSEQVRVGVVGTSWWADMMYLPCLKSHPAAEIAAICGRNRDRLEEIAQKHGISLTFTDYQEMIEKGNLDAVIVATPDDLHYPITMKALEAGLHVLCEKSMALTLEHAREMYNKAEEAGVKHMVPFTWRWLPPFQYAHQLIKEGYLGRCFHSQFRYVGGYGRDGQYRWKWDRRRGLGILGDLGVHMIDMAHWLIGDIAKVSAHLPVFIERPGPQGQPLDPANDSALLALKFKDGGQGSIYVSALAHVGNHDQEFQVILYGEAGTLEVDLNFRDGYIIRGARSDEDQIRPLAIPEEILKGVDPESPFEEQIFDQIFMKQLVGTRLFIEAIINDGPLSPTLYDGLKAQAVIDAAIKSDQRECWVSLE